MKPLLERKRRARINKCLDELKEIMTAALTSQGENVSKLEKADILELTLSHLKKMHQARRLMVSTNRNPLEEIHRFQAGYSSCAQEAASFLLATPGVDARVSQRLLSHLSSNTITPRTPFGPVHSPIPPSFPMTCTLGISVPLNASNTLHTSKDEGKHHPGIAQSQQTATFPSRLSATTESRRRSSGGMSLASEYLLSPKAISSLSLPESSPTSSLTVDTPARSLSVCDTSSIERCSIIDDKKQTHFLPNLTPSSQCSILSSEGVNRKETSWTSSATSNRAEKSILDDNDLNSYKCTIKFENGCEKKEYSSKDKSSDIIARLDNSEKNMEIKHVPIKPEPMRLPSLHQQPQSITDPVWRPF